MIFDSRVREEHRSWPLPAREVLTINRMTIGETGEPGTGARFEIRVPNGRVPDYPGVMRQLYRVFRCQGPGMRVLFRRVTNLSRVQIPADENGCLFPCN
jgi:hypothetical protein